MLWAPGDGSALLRQTENDATEGNPSGEETPTTLQSHLPTSWAHPWDKSISPPSAPCQHLSRGRSTQQKSFSPDMSNGMSSTNSPALGTAAADGHRALLGVLGRCVKHSHVLSCMGTHAVRLGGGTERTGTTPPGSNEDGWLLGRCVGKGRAPRRCRKLGTEPRGHNPVPASSSRGDVHSLQRVPAGPAARVPYGAAPSRHGHEWCKTPNAAPPPSELSRAPGLCPHACPPPSAQ